MEIMNKLKFKLEHIVTSLDGALQTSQRTTRELGLNITRTNYKNWLYKFLMEVNVQKNYKWSLASFIYVQDPQFSTNQFAR